MQSDTTYDLLEVWNMSDRLVHMFDPTASNRGAAKIIEERLRKTVLLYMSAPHPGTNCRRSLEISVWYYSWTRKQYVCWAQISLERH